MRQRWLSRRAFTLHVEFGILVVACVALAWWQATRALEGNFLSWFYTFEWPILGCVALAGWWHLLHEDPEKYRRRKLGLEDWDDVPESERADETLEG